MELIPSSQRRHSFEFYNFIGKMLAKAVYSGILLEPQFSPVFLNLLLGRSNQIDDMSYLDDQVSPDAFI
jgi:ubiquitin-protein ligase E3 C